MPLVDLANPSQLDTAIFNTWLSYAGGPAYALTREGRFAPTQNGFLVTAGPGAFVAPSYLERGYNAWAGAPGYYADMAGVDRVVPDQYLDDTLPPAIGVNPWDHVFGTYGAGALDYMPRVQARTQPIQAGVYSFG